MKKGRFCWLSSLLCLSSAGFCPARVGNQPKFRGGDGSVEKRASVCSRLSVRGSACSREERDPLERALWDASRASEGCEPQQQRGWGPAAYAV